MCEHERIGMNNGVRCAECQELLIKFDTEKQIWERTDGQEPINISPCTILTY